MSEITDFTFRPVADKKPAYSSFYAFVSLSFLTVVPSVSLDKYQGVFSLVAVIFFVVAMAIYSRYLIGEYAYAVFTSSEGRAVLVVTKTSGKRVSTLYSVFLSEIRGVKHFVSKNEERVSGVKKYNYCPSMKPRETIELKVNCEGVESLVILEGTEALADRLKAVSEQAFANERAE